MPNVSAPYNFVPLNKEVFFPPWADLVSHDVPFKEGLSGKIKLKITAETPIFIRKPYEEGDDFYEQERDGKKIKISKEFCHIKDVNGNKKYYIPGSSIRNMLRSIVEIMGFGKLNFISDTLKEKKAYRDMGNLHLYTIATDVKKMGWLFKNADESIVIKSCNAFNEDFLISRPKKVDANVLINKHFIKFYKNCNENPNKKCIYKRLASAKTLTEKYNIYKRFYENAKIPYIKADNKILVLTGNISKKSHEFLFSKIENCNENEIQVEDGIWQIFEKINNNSENWNFWKDKFSKNQPIPVFFREKDGELMDFGLTVLYKWLYKYSPKELIDKQQKQNSDKRYDLAQTIFGDISNEKLKGRVTVQHAFSDNAVTDDEKTLILGSPKETYYPFYIKQSVRPNTIVTGEYNTYNNADAKIAGRKRYPIHNQFDPNEILPFANQQEQEEQEQEQGNVETHFKPIKEAVFNTNIVYHNLLPEELGALISAVTFHGNNENYKHNIGMAKPYGYGKIKIDIETNFDFDKLLCEYELMMDMFTKKHFRNKEEWLQTEQIIELFSMSFDDTQQLTENLKYMELENFSKIKNRRINGQLVRKALPKYSKFMQPNNEIIERDCSEVTTNEYKRYAEIKSLIFDKYNEIRSQIENVNKNLELSQKSFKDYYAEIKSNDFQFLLSALEKYVKINDTFSNEDKEYIITNLFEFFWNFKNVSLNVKKGKTTKRMKIIVAIEENELLKDKFNNWIITKRQSLEGNVSGSKKKKKKNRK